MNKNVMIGGGVIALGLFLAFRAKKKGKEVPFIGRFIPAGEMSNASGNFDKKSHLPSVKIRFDFEISYKKFLSFNVLFFSLNPVEMVCLHTFPYH